MWPWLVLYSMHVKWLIIFIFYDVCLFLWVTFSWTKERRVLLVKSFEKKRWVVVRPLPFSRTYPQQYDVSSSTFTQIVFSCLCLEKEYKSCVLVTFICRCVFTWWSKRNVTTLGTALLHIVWKKEMCGPTWRTTVVRVTTFFQINKVKNGQFYVTSFMLITRI